MPAVAEQVEGASHVKSEPRSTIGVPQCAADANAALPSQRPGPTTLRIQVAARSLLAVASAVVERAHRWRSAHGGRFCLLVFRAPPIFPGKIPHLRNKAQ